MQVAELLQQGAMNKDIAEQLVVAKSLVSKVAKALKKGFLPPETSYEAKKVTTQYQAAAAPMPEENHPPEQEGFEYKTPVVSGHHPVEYKQAQSSQSQQSL